MMNKPTHHSGKGLFISRRSSSHTWPVVPSYSCAETFTLAENYSKNAQYTIPKIEMADTKIDQKLLVKSLMIRFLYKDL